MVKTRKVAEAAISAPGIIILQWLTYVFWGWTIVAVAYLVSAVVGAAFPDASYVSATAEPVAYGAAALLILLPISLICDVLFSKNEPNHKTGIAVVIMVIHAVLFAMIAIGSLVALLFTVISWILSTTGSTAPLSAIVTAVSVAVLFALLLVRTIKPLIIRPARTVFRVVFVIVAVGITTLAVIGPVAETLKTKDDRAVRDSLSMLQSGVGQYASINNALPSAIADTYSSQYMYDSHVVKELVSRNLVTYTPNTKDSTTADGTVSYYYELCGVFTHGISDGWYGGVEPVSKSSEEATDGYMTWIDQGPVTAGTQCYKLIATYYNDTPIRQ